jgi:mannosyltransferase
VADRDGVREPDRVSAVTEDRADAPASGVAPWRRPGVLRVAGVLAIMALWLWLRTHAITAKFWIDEGLSVGIAHHPLFDIPGVLRKDGSPPLYYMLLHVWMSVVGGDGEARTHAFSVLFATLTIPAGWWAGRRLFGERAAWATAALCATLPFLTYYAQETRMYALVAFLGLCSSAAFTMAYAQRDRRWIPAFSVLTVLTVYAHNWGLFLAVGMGAAFLVLWRTSPAAERRPFFRDGLLGFGLLVLLYLPWIPTLLFQAKHTGAPWSDKPPLDGLISGLQNLVGGVETALLLTVVAGAGLMTLRGGREGVSARGRSSPWASRSASRSRWRGWPRRPRRRGRPATSRSSSARPCCSRARASCASARSGSSRWRSSWCCGSTRTSARSAARATPTAWRAR